MTKRTRPYDDDHSLVHSHHFDTIKPDCCSHESAHGPEDNSSQLYKTNDSYSKSSSSSSPPPMNLQCKRRKSYHSSLVYTLSIEDHMGHFMFSEVNSSTVNMSTLMNYLITNWTCMKSVDIRSLHFVAKMSSKIAPSSVATTNPIWLTESTTFTNQNIQNSHFLDREAILGKPLSQAASVGEELEVYAVLSGQHGQNSKQTVPLVTLKIIGQKQSQKDIFMNVIMCNQTLNMFQSMAPVL